MMQAFIPQSGRCNSPKFLINKGDQSLLSRAVPCPQFEKKLGDLARADLQGTRLAGMEMK
jgi:hypothetical protein